MYVEFVIWAHLCRSIEKKIYKINLINNKIHKKNIYICIFMLKFKIDGSRSFHEVRKWNGEEACLFI